MNIALTGSKGFIGSYLKNALEDKRIAEVKEFDREKHSLFNPKSLKGFVKDVDVFFHLAGANRDSNLNLVRTNTLGTLGLLESIAKFGKKGAKIVFSSSFQVYTANNEVTIVDEEARPSPKSIYGSSKLFAEMLVKQYCKNNAMKGIILRLSNVYGPGGKPFYNSVIATFVHLVKKEERITIYGNGEQARDFVFVEDVVRAFEKCLDYNPNVTDIFNICSGNLNTLNDVVEILQNIAKDKEIEVGYDVSKGTEHEFIRGDFSKAAEMLNWSPQYKLEDGLREIMND